jgi:hypothetical protein
VRKLKDMPLSRPKCIWKENNKYLEEKDGRVWTGFIHLAEYMG